LPGSRWSDRDGAPGDVCRSPRTRVALLALLVGGGSGLAGRVLTAGVVGANIGGAFAVVVWLVLVPLAT
jgi:hypothetical protein